MNDKILEKKVMIYPGKDSEYNYKAISLRNTIVAGGVGSGVTSIMNQIILKLITDNSPSYVQIDYWDYSTETSLWSPKRKGAVDTERWVPQFARITSSEQLTLEEYLVDVQEEINNRKAILDDISFECYNRCSSSKLPSYICVINDLGSDVPEALLNLLKDCERYGVYFIISSVRHIHTFKELIDLCSNRICARCLPELSESMLNSDVASVDMPKSSLCYFWNAEDTKEPILIYVPFTLDLFIMKLVGALAVRKENLN